MAYTRDSNARSVQGRRGLWHKALALTQISGLRLLSRSSLGYEIATSAPVI